MYNAQSDHLSTTEPRRQLQVLLAGILRGKPDTAEVKSTGSSEQIIKHIIKIIDV